MYKFILTVSMLFFPFLSNAVELLKTQTSWDGGEIYYPKGKAEISAHKIHISRGHKVEFHCHPVPTMFYVIKGKLEVETKSGEKYLIKEGEAAVEVMHTTHRGHEIDGPVEILVFYAGAVGTSNTIIPTSGDCK